jgi:hypothetical protein
MANYTNLNFIQNQNSCNSFLQDAKITEEERHRIILQTRTEILKQSKKLNKLMNNCNIGTEQRVVYVSGMLLCMQDVVDEFGNIVFIARRAIHQKFFSYPQDVDIPWGSKPIDVEKQIFARRKKLGYNRKLTDYEQARQKGTT